MSSSPITARIAQLHEQWRSFTRCKDAASQLPVAEQSVRWPLEVHLAKLLGGAWREQLVKAS